MTYFTVTTARGVTLSVPAATAAAAADRVERDFGLFAMDDRVTAVAEDTDVAAVMIAAGLA